MTGPARTVIDIEALTAPMPADTRAVAHAIATRRSVRGFKPTPVPRETVAAILALAARAPSGSNIQPWQVHVCAGAKRDAVVSAVQTAVADEPDAHSGQYQYYPKTWRTPYIERRRATGWGLYGTLGIAKGDNDAMAAQHARNFDLFDAPVGLFFTIDPDMETGSWLDFGMFIQSVMIAARGFGLDTCPQAAWTKYWRVIFPVLDIDHGQILVCGMALGECDPEAPANAFWTPREPVDTFATFTGFDDGA